MPGGVELGEFGVDVDGDGAAQSRCCRIGPGIVDEQVRVDAAALSVAGGRRPARVYSVVQVVIALVARVRHIPARSAAQVPPLHRAFVGVGHVAF